MGTNKAQSLFAHDQVPTKDRKLNFLDVQPLSIEAAEGPGAYSWGYRWIDEFGTQMFREETSNGRGTVWGRYSFREATVSRILSWHNLD